MIKFKIYFGLLALSTLLLLSCSNKHFIALSEEENKYQLTTEFDLKEDSYSKKIENFYKSGNEGFFNGKADVQIYYREYKQTNNKKAILISSGRTEAAIKYKELIYDLYQNGYSVYIHDHRGQGLSGRMTTNPQMGYIDTFQFYVNDMKYFYKNHIKPQNYIKKYLLTHSMGGAIGMTYLEQYPNDFDAAAFSSPMLGLKPPICNIIAVLDGEEPKFALGESEYNDAKKKFKGNTLTGSKTRYERMISAYKNEPKARLGGATYTWVHKSCQQFEYLFSNIDKIETPFILFSAENEQIVHLKAHLDFVNKAREIGKNCIGYEVKNAQHELLIEKDVQRIETINKTLDFYSKY